LRAYNYLNLMLRSDLDAEPLLTAYMKQVVAVNYNELGLVNDDDFEGYTDTLRRVSVAERACLFK